MALSNWATMAIMLNSTIINTVDVDWPTSPSGILVEIYKNWLYVHDEASPERPNNRFMHPTVMSVEHGSVVYADWHNEARRGPQDGVYVVAWFSDLNPDPNEASPLVRGFVGCGVDGYDGKEWVGVRATSLDFLRAWLANKEIDFPPAVSGLVVPDGSVNQGAAFFRRNVPKLADPSFNLEKAR